jgi:hypothetical protein
MTTKEPASIRYKNPGAMWGSALAVKWGASPKAVTLNDGKGQGNNIAVFPTYLAGICAQLDLWRSSKNYRNKPFKDAIAIWSGHNNVESYIAFVLKRVPGMTRNTIMDDAFWRSDKGIAFLKAQAWHEAGKKYPAPDEDWIEAQRRVFGKVVIEAPVVPSTPARPIETPKPENKDGAVVAAGGAAAVAGYGVWQFAQDYALYIGGGFVALIILILIIFRIAKGRWPWTGRQSQVSSGGLPQVLASSSAQALDRLALLSAESLVTLSPKPLASKPRRKPSRPRSPKTRTRSKNSASSKRPSSSKSSRTRKSR